MVELCAWSAGALTSRPNQRPLYATSAITHAKEKPLEVWVYRLGLDEDPSRGGGLRVRSRLARFSCGSEMLNGRLCRGGADREIVKDG